MALSKVSKSHKKEPVTFIEAISIFKKARLTDYSDICTMGSLGAAPTLIFSGYVYNITFQSFAP
jgi:hypothetical protein